MSDLQTRVCGWLSDQLGWSNPRFMGALSGGNSNLSWHFRADEQQCVVRTTPNEAISPNSGRGIEREAKVLKAVAGRVKSAELYGFCNDLSVIERPFLVQEFIDGVSITQRLPEGYSDPVAATNALGLDLVAQLAKLHEISWPDASLDGLGKPDNFIERQVDRWMAVRAEQSERELPQLFELGDWLKSHIPPSEGAALTHGDYHLDNTLASKHSPEIMAIIDWELATVGEPAMDVALALLFWGPKRVPEPPGFAHLQAITRQAGVIDRQALANHWASLTGRSVEHMGYYIALAAWRLAAIVEGAYCLYVQGKVDTPYAASLAHDVPALLLEAQHAAQGDW